jgi:hypothetical protein
MKNQIYQIYYSEATKAQNDLGFLPLDNLANERPDWREYWPIRNFLLKNELAENTSYGFFSPKFKDKTNLEASDVVNFISNNKSEVFIFSPYFEQSALNFNIFEHLESAHLGSIKIAEKCIQKINPEINIYTMLMDSRSTVFCNYLAATKSFWMEWLACCEVIFNVAESNNSYLSEELNKQVEHDGGFADRKVFIIERIASLLIEKNSIATKVYNPSKFQMTSEIWENFTNELLILDALKIATNLTGFESYIKLFDSERRKLLAKVKEKVESVSYKS